MIFPLRWRGSAPSGPECIALTGATIKDRLRIAALLARQGRGAARGVLASPGRALGRLRARAPERLLIAPQDIRTADPTVAADIGAGYFAFGGKIANAMGRSPFALEPGSEAWARQLAGFGWLRHLRAADNIAIRARARGLVGDFLDAHVRPAPGLAWEPRVAARRMLAWLSQSPVILAGADSGFYGRFTAALETHRAFLERQSGGGLPGDDRLLVALALAEYGLCVEGAGTLQKRSTDALAAEIGAQVLPDGGPVSRNPQVLIDLLLDLLPLRQAYAARSVPAPPQLLNAIDRMMPMLRLFRHGDGSLALFNGMGQTAPELVATVLAYDDARARALGNAPYAGYQRLEAEGTILVVEAGAPPPHDFSTAAHAGCLSFELSSAARKVVINCGAPEGGRASAREASRSTAAHSTLVIDDTSSCRFATGGTLSRWLGEQVLAGPSAVIAEREEHDDTATLALSHDGYAARFGLVHHRALTLAAGGDRLDGHDRLAEVAGARRPAGPVPYAVRFHLHPSFKARATPDGAAVRLDAPDGESWLFESDAEAFVEPSILFAAPGGPRPTVQIKVLGEAGTRPEIRWSLRRLAVGDAPRR